MGDNAEDKAVQVSTHIGATERDKLDRIVKKYRFRSRYQLVQCIVRSFLKVADPEPGEYVPKDIEEMFDEYQSPSREEFQDVKRGPSI